MLGIQQVSRPSIYRRISLSEEDYGLTVLEGANKVDASRFALFAAPTTNLEGARLEDQAPLEEINMQSCSGRSRINPSALCER